MEDISIEFPGVKALKNVHFSTTTGTTHALIGANGAGKSTLMKVLSGAYNHYAGEIRIDGAPVTVRSPKDAKQLGIEIVHQEVDTALIPYLTVGENIMLDVTVNDPARTPFLNWQAIHRQARRVLDRLNVNVSTRKLVSELTLAEKQMILIARAISRKCRFLILDEPTAPLSLAETEELFRIVRRLKEENVGIIFISHRLPELFRICDEITIMRDGEFVTRNKMADMTQSRIVEHMLGRKLEQQFPKYDADIGAPLFEARDFGDGNKVKNINLVVREGEVVGLAGLVGAGKTELCKALFGAGEPAAGERLLRGRKLTIKSPHHAVRQGLALVPEERRKEGVLVQESVTGNLTTVVLSALCRLGTFLHFQREKELADRYIRELGIKTPSGQTKVQHLSGGNQQKVAIGKWLAADADLYMFDEPTKGVDVGAKKDIFELIGRLAARGKGILYASCEPAEIMGITDRIYVMYDGEIVKELVTKDTTEEELMFYSTGGR